MAVSTIEDRRAVFDRTADRSREIVALAVGNQASASVTVAGGVYSLDATATTYGEIRVDMQRGDGTWMPLATVTSADRPVDLRLPAGAVVRAVLAATTGARAILSRVPA